MFDINEYKKELMESDDIEDCPKVPLPLIGEEQNYIFISYSHKDYKEVYSDLAELYVSGVRFWYDTGLPAGKHWEKEVKAKLVNPHCVGVIFYLSENLFESNSANKEIQIVYDMDDSEQAKERKNYFSVNLTKKRPFEILSSVIAKGGDKLNMNHVRTISQAFPDEATYLTYKSRNHIKELISQIKMQFGVVEEATDGEEEIFTNIAGCDVCITYPVQQKLTSDLYQAAKELKDYIKRKGLSCYLLQHEEDLMSFNTEIYAATIKTNRIKFESCKFFIVLSNYLIWQFTQEAIEKEFCEYPDKELIYLLLDSGMCKEMITGKMKEYMESKQCFFFGEHEEKLEHILFK